MLRITATPRVVTRRARGIHASAPSAPLVTLDTLTRDGSHSGATLPEQRIRPTTIGLSLCTMTDTPGIPPRKTQLVDTRGRAAGTGPLETTQRQAEDRLQIEEAQCGHLGTTGNIPVGGKCTADMMSL